MYKILAGLFFFFTVANQLEAQISPKEGSRLNYRLIGLSFPVNNAINNKIEIATGNINNEDSFSKNIISSYYSGKNKMICEVPSFGKQYTWRIISTTLDSIKTKSRLYHFSTKMNSHVDTSITHLRIIQPAEKFKDAYVFLDGTRTLYDMKGNPVWFLPDIDGDPAETMKLSDLKLTPQGTITFMSDRKNGAIYEADYNGNILWKALNNEETNNAHSEVYHHEFTRLPNGHYMTLGNKVVLWKLPASLDSASLQKPDVKNKVIRKHNAFYERMYLATVIEYNEKGKEVWRWRSSQYFKQGADVYYKTNNDGTYEIDDPHLNSFYFDEKEQAIYLSFRNISRVLKIAYPGGEVLSTYGNPYINGIKDTAKDLFCWQHCCRHSPNGYIYMFNNNTCHHGGLPRITMIQDPVSGKDASKKLWDYECTIDGVETKRQYQFANGGNVIELTDGSIFANMSHEEYTKVFIVNKDKNILWSAIPEQWNTTEHRWAPVFQYRASIITSHEDLERLIWSGATVK